MAGGWNILGDGGTSSLVPETAFFEGDSAYKCYPLSKTARLKGFLISVAIGFILSLLGIILLFFGLLLAFFLLYIVGTIVTLLATGFLIGFLNQLKLMFKPVRIVATIVLIASIVLVLVGILALGNGAITAIFFVVEYLAYTWYALSYIPYARTAVIKAVGLG